MAFIKKNLLKIIFGVLVLTGIIFTLMAAFKLALILLYDHSTDFDRFQSEMWSSMLKQVAVAVSLLAIFASIILKILNKCEKSVPFIALAGGGIALAIMIASWIVGKEHFTYLKEYAELYLNAEGKSLSYKYKLYLYHYAILDMVIYTLVFACAPILYGCKKFFKAKTKIIFGALILTGLVFTLIILIELAVILSKVITYLNGRDKSEIWNYMLKLIAITASLLVIFAIVVRKVINKGEKAIPFISLACGVIVLAFMIAAYVIGREYFVYFKDVAKRILPQTGKKYYFYRYYLYIHFYSIVNIIISTLVFACAPIFYGCKKLLKAKAKAKENPPA